MSISSIAFACGFSSEAHFCRRFKAAFKMTPREVRAQGLSDSLCQIGNKEKLSPTEFQQFFTHFSTAH
jgi:AraC-like DNA-binding protein